MADHLNNKPYGAWIAIDIAKDFNAVACDIPMLRQTSSTAVPDSACRRT